MKIDKQLNVGFQLTASLLDTPAKVGVSFSAIINSLFKP